MRALTKWDHRFMRLCTEVGSWSKDPSRGVGAVIVEPVTQRFVSAGYNGFPRGVDDSPQRYAERDLKLKLVRHAEPNAILFAERSVRGMRLYCNYMPCAQCAGAIIQAGIVEVVANWTVEPKWQADFELAEEMFNEAGVSLVLINNNKNEGAQCTKC